MAYVLAGAGYRDIQVVEQGELAGATSGQAAGLVGQVRATKERCMLAMASVAVYARIEQETGYPADWRQTGSVRIAVTAERVAEFLALAVVAQSAGLEVEFLTPSRLAALCPMLDTTQVKAALWCPTDGYLQPHSLVTAYARAARDRGVTFATHTAVTGLRIIDTASIGAGPIPTLISSERFAARNRFYGGQLGLRGGHATLGGRFASGRDGIRFGEPHTFFAVGLGNL